MKNTILATIIILFSLMFTSCGEDNVTGSNINNSPHYYANVTVIYHRLLIYNFNAELIKGEHYKTPELNNFDSVTVNINFSWNVATNDSLYWQIDYAGINEIILTDTTLNYQHSFYDRIESPISFGFYSINNE